MITNLEHKHSDLKTKQEDHLHSLMQENQTYKLKDLKKSSIQCDAQTSDSQSHVINRASQAIKNLKSKDNQTLADQKTATGNIRLSIQTTCVRHVTIQEENCVYTVKHTTI